MDAFRALATSGRFAVLAAAAPFLAVLILADSLARCAGQEPTPPSAAKTEVWPEIPNLDGRVRLPAQEWPRRPGARHIEALVYFPGGRLDRVDERTGLMLTLHNWGGTDCEGTANPQTLAERLNVVALCVNYLQSGKRDAIEASEPYDFGYLQALDALRALWWAQSGLRAKGRPLASGRIFAAGGSGGGNVALIANKLAPRTLACVVDMSGMKKLSPDVAFGLPGGSDLNARWSRVPSHAHYLSPDEQDLRFVAHPEHLAQMTRLGNQCRVVVVHGVEDTTCPIAEARELAANFEAAGLSVAPCFISRSEVDGAVFTGSGHALGDRTRIALHVAGEWLAPEGPRALARRGPSDFDLKDERVRYRTPAGEFIISYAAGYPVGRFAPDEPAPPYDEHHDLGYYLDRSGKKQAIHTPADWQIRRGHVLSHLSRVMGRLPGAAQRVPLDLKVLEESRAGKVLRRKLSFQSDPFDRVSAWLLLPDADQVARRPAVLCLHQTTRAGKDEPIGLAGSPHMHYGRELAERGYVVLAPDYPSLGEHAYDFSAHPEFASGSLKGAWDNLRAVDLLAALPEVDPERIGVIGHSLGGHNAVFTALFEPRLKAVVSSCGFSSMLKDDLPSWTGPRYMPRIATEFANDARRLPFDFSELIGCLAPRPVFISAATRDDDFDVTGVQDVVRAALPVFRLLGQPEGLQAIYPETAHDFPPEAREQAYAFLDRHLRRKAE